jgi:hypothetical protein
MYHIYIANLKFTAFKNCSFGYPINANALHKERCLKWSRIGAETKIVKVRQKMILVGLFNASVIKSVA